MASVGKKGALRQRLIEEGRHKSSMETQTPHLIPKPSEVFRWVAESFPATATGEGGRGKLSDAESGARKGELLHAPFRNNATTMRAAGFLLMGECTSKARCSRR
jgi:hypothetical protein